jgi:copper(I)-binding protein
MEESGTGPNSTLDRLGWLPAAASDAWARGTMALHKATGVFMQISSAQGGRLVSVASPAAAAVQIHEMKLDGATMKMRALPRIKLPASKAIELKPVVTT